MKANSIAIIGSLPKPIGGVSAFCSNLCQSILAKSDAVIYFYDCYFGNKNIDFLKENRFNYYNVSNNYHKIFRYFWLLVNIFSCSSRTLFINFSTASSLYFVFFVLFFSHHKRVYICLHHGTLEEKRRMDSFVFKTVLNKVYKVFSLNENQKKFYLKYLSDEKIVETSSYISLFDDNPLRIGVTGAEDNLIIAGSDDDYYNVYETYDLLNRYYQDNLHFTANLTIVVYGRCSDEFLSRLLAVESSCNLNTTVVHELSNAEFNKLLSKQDLYIRNTSRDSLGLIVGDALSLGVPVLASNVCPRASGCYLFNYTTSSSFIQSFDHLLLGKKVSISKEDIQAFNIDDLVFTD